MIGTSFAIVGLPSRLPRNSPLSPWFCSGHGPLHPCAAYTPPRTGASPSVAREIVMKNVVAIEMIVVSALVGGVVLEAEQQKLNEVKAKEKQLVEMSSNFKDYARRLAALAEDLMADRCTLVEAV